MKVKYYKDYRHNYLIMTDNDTRPENTYQQRMITENQIRGLVPCQERYINGEMLLYYEITSKHSISHIYSENNIGKEELQKLFVQMKLVNDLLEKYLLCGEGLMLQPEYIFQDLETGEYSFLYYPDARENSFQILMDFLISRIDNEDEEAVEMVYRITDLAQRDRFAMDEILSWFTEAAINTEQFEQTEDEDKNMNMTYETAPEYQKQVCIEERKTSGIGRFFRKLFGKKEKENEVFLPGEREIYTSVNETGEQRFSEGLGNTVFIPWTESCENKLYGLERGNKYHIDLAKLPLTVGKLAGAVDMVIRDQSISRMHVKFSRSGGKILMTDLNSTNGTFRNGMRLAPNASETIEPGDEIRLGKLKFIYR